MANGWRSRRPSAAARTPISMLSIRCSRSLLAWSCRWKAEGGHRRIFPPTANNCWSTKGSEFHQLTRLHLADGRKTVLSHERWDVDEFDLSKDGKRIACVTNEM